MNRRHYYVDWIIFFSFFISIIMCIIPWPTQLCFFRPSWLNLSLIYWAITLPYRVNISTGFMLGLSMDFVYGSTLGIRALALSILTYLAVSNFQLFRNAPLWQQSLTIILMSVIVQVVIFLAKFLIDNIYFQPTMLWNAMLDGILWPWILLLMRKICRCFSCYT